MRRSVFRSIAGLASPLSSTGKAAASASKGCMNGCRQRQSPFFMFALQTRDMSNKIINAVLLQDLPGKGLKGEVVALRPGFLRNYLYPNQLATYATPENIQRFALSPRDLAKAKVAFARQTLHDSTIEVQVQTSRANWGVSASTVRDTLAKQFSVTVKPDALMPCKKDSVEELSWPIKSLGVYTLKLSFAVDASEVGDGIDGSGDSGGDDGLEVFVRLVVRKKEEAVGVAAGAGGGAGGIVGSEARRPVAASVSASA